MKPLLIFLLAWLGLPAVHAQATDMLKLTKTIPLAGVKGRFDHFAADVEGKRLFVAALGNTHLFIRRLAGASLSGQSGIETDFSARLIRCRLQVLQGAYVTTQLICAALARVSA